MTHPKEFPHAVPARRRRSRARIQPWSLLAGSAAAAAALLLPAAAALGDGIWTGAGPDANWSTGQNWDNGQPPAAGASLYFPFGSARPVSFNDLPPQTFSRVTLSGAAPNTIEGNGFTVTDGLVLVGTYTGTV